jgi:hypothetical protein
MANLQSEKLCLDLMTCTVHTSECLSSYDESRTDKKLVTLQYTDPAVCITATIQITTTINL